MKTAMGPGIRERQSDGYQCLWLKKFVVLSLYWTETGSEKGEDDEECDNGKPRNGGAGETRSYHERF